MLSCVGAGNNALVRDALAEEAKHHVANVSDAQVNDCNSMMKVEKVFFGHLLSVLTLKLGQPLQFEGQVC